MKAEKLKAIKVALISPKGNKFGKNEHLRYFLEQNPFMESFKLLWSGPNLGLLTLASYFPTSWEFEYIDENIRSIDYKKNYDIVFISAMTQQANRGYEIATHYKKLGILTVMGGIHVSTIPEEACKFVDVILTGEAELAFPIFLQDFIQGTIKERYDPPPNRPFDLKKSILPRYDLIQNETYPVISIQTTRGCPHNCSFCAASKVFGNTYRCKSIEQILLEVDTVIGYFPGRLILFADDNAFVNKKAGIALLKKLEQRHIRFIAQVDISIAQDEELLFWMTRAGCQWVVIGFESVNIASLQNLDANDWKMKQSQKYIDSIKKIHEFGIGVYGTFIVGLDEDNSDIFEKTAKFITDNHLYGANITIPTPLPGTQLRQQLQSEDRILTMDWDYYTLWDPVISFRKFSHSEIIEGLINIYNEVNSDENAHNRLLFLRRLVGVRKKILEINHEDI